MFKSSEKENLDSFILWTEDAPLKNVGVFWSRTGEQIRYHCIGLWYGFVVMSASINISYTSVVSDGNSDFTKKKKEQK